MSAALRSSANVHARPVSTGRRVSLQSLVIGRAIEPFSLTIRDGPGYATSVTKTRLAIALLLLGRTTVLAAGFALVDFFGAPDFDHGVALVMSPDAQFVYVSSYSGIEVSRRDPTTGLTTIVGETPIETATYYYNSMVISPDGKHLYAAQGTASLDPELYVYERNATTGALTEVDEYGDRRRLRHDQPRRRPGLRERRRLVGGLHARHRDRAADAPRDASRRTGRHHRSHRRPRDRHARRRPRLCHRIRTRIGRRFFARWRNGCADVRRLRLRRDGRHHRPSRRRGHDGERRRGLRLRRCLLRQGRHNFFSRRRDGRADPGGGGPRRRRRRPGGSAAAL